MGKKSAFIIGGLLGAGVALMLAPRTGAETRAMVGEFAGSFLGNSSGDGEAAPVDVKQVWDAAYAKGEELIAKGKAAAEQFGAKAAEVAQETVTKAAAVASDAAARGADVAGDTFAKVQDVANTAAAKAKDVYVKAVGKASEAADDVVAAYADKDDELRARMELARQRIAEQIAKNAEEAKARREAIAATVVTPVEEADRKSTRLNSSHTDSSRMPSSA